MDAERLTGSAEKVLLEAVAEAGQEGTTVGIRHLIDALKSDRVLQKLNATFTYDDDPEPSEESALSEDLVLVLDDAQGFADSQHEPFVSTEHMVIALMQMGVMDIAREQVFASIGSARSVHKVGQPVRVNPLDALERSALLDMENELHKVLIGQDKAVRVVSETVRRAAAGLTDSNRPFGSFLFLGPTGVGKTELSKCLADFLYGTKSSMVRIDMSEYREQHSIARLIGSPPGYVGHSDGGQLTNALAENPYSLVLFDEMEKAHPDVLNVLLQVFDDGRLTDGRGITVDMTSSVVVMTSNVGSKAYTAGADPDKTKDRVMDAVWSQFRPEFLNRIDEIVVFDSLTKEDFYKIVDIQLAPVIAMMEAREVDLVLEREAVVFLVEGGWNPVLGARQLRRFIQRKLQNPLAEKLLASEFKGKSVCTVSAGTDELEFSIKEA